MGAQTPGGQPGAGRGLVCRSVHPDEWQAIASAPSYDEFHDALNSVVARAKAEKRCHQT